MTKPQEVLSRRRFHQRGIVLFIALIALVAMSLAAVALMRSVDTNTIIAGNLAFMQSARSSADSGVETALTWLAGQATMDPSSPIDNPAHPFNADNPAEGYYSSITAPADLFADTTWAAAVSKPATGSLYDALGNEYLDAGHTQPTGNTVRYIIQRMSRTANEQLSCSNSLFSGYEKQTGKSMAGGSIGDYTEEAKDPTLGCLNVKGAIVESKGTSSAFYRVTVRVTGPKNSVTYVQAYAY